jgi:enolase
MSIIIKIARQIFDSRGNPTIEVDVVRHGIRKSCSISQLENMRQNYVMEGRKSAVKKIPLLLRNFRNISF